MTATLPLLLREHRNNLRLDGKIARVNALLAFQKLLGRMDRGSAAMNKPNTASTTSTTKTTSSPEDQSTENDIKVRGLSLTPLTQCKHWNSPFDIIAIRHACCEKFYACISCHDALENHISSVWSHSQRHERAVLCGKCKHVLQIDEYLSCGSVCTSCGAGFNPGCKGHWGLYFEMEEGGG
jgi:uncharacterized CHY-type Zn-finger protein